MLAIKINQPVSKPLPEINVISGSLNVVEKFTATLVSIGGAVIEIKTLDGVLDFLDRNFKNKTVITTIADLSTKIGTADFQLAPHQFANVNLAILPGEFGVAENGAVWITDSKMGDRALPYISEHLALIINRSAIVATLHDAYERIGNSDYNLGTFIAGPSKTADIEQSLVLGAHGAKSLVVFLLG